MEMALDPLTQAKVDQLYTETRIMTPTEVRERLGMDALTPEEVDSAWPPPPVTPPSSVEATGTGSAAPSGEAEVQKMFSVVVNTPEIHQGDTFVRVNNQKGES